MKKIKLQEIKERIKKIEFEDFDVVVGIAEGGIVPAVLVAQHLGTDVEVVKIRYRDEDNNPIYDSPQVIGEVELSGKRVLLVDDVSRSGKTLEKGREVLKGNTVKTFVLVGKADYSLFDFKECVEWPWK